MKHRLIFCLLLLCLALAASAATTNRSVNEGQWKLVNVKKTVGSGAKAEHPTDGPVLFDLAHDIGETNDISKQYPEILRRLDVKTIASPKHGDSTENKQSE